MKSEVERATSGLDLFLNQEQLEFRTLLREFVAAECPPALVNEWEMSGEYPAGLYQELAQLGCFALPFPSEYGGMSGGPLDMCVLGEELGRAGFDIASGLGISVFCGLNLLHHGTSEQKERYLPPLLRGELRFSVAISEPESGSDAASLKTRAALTDGMFVVNGQKMFITGAHVPDTIIHVACRTDPDAPTHEGISVVLVPNDLPGVTVSPLRSMGRNIVQANAVFLDDVRVPSENLVGPLNGGWGVIRAGLQLERLFASAAYVGAAQSALDEALSYAKQRKQFGRAIGDFQAVAHLLAEMQTQLDAARALLYHAAWLKSHGYRCEREISEAKLFGSEMFGRVARDALQIMGGYGYMLESSIQRHLRDAVSTTITAGTSQVHRTIIARNLGLNVE